MGTRFPLTVRLGCVRPLAEPHCDILTECAYELQLLNQDGNSNFCAVALQADVGQQAGTPFCGDVRSGAPCACLQPGLLLCLVHSLKHAYKPESLLEVSDNRACQQAPVQGVMQ